jgi:hypothetical protein
MSFDRFAHASTNFGRGLEKHVTGCICPPFSGGLFFRPNPQMLPQYFLFSSGSHPSKRLDTKIT